MLLILRNIQRLSKNRFSPCGIARKGDAGDFRPGASLCGPALGCAPNPRAVSAHSGNDPSRVQTPLPVFLVRLHRFAPFRCIHAITRLGVFEVPRIVYRDFNITMEWKVLIKFRTVPISHV